MANAIIEINTDGVLAGATGLTADVTAEGSDTVSFSGVAMTEATNRKGVFTGTVSGPTAGDYLAQLKTGSTVLGDFYGPLTNAAVVHLFGVRAGRLAALDATMTRLGTPAGASVSADVAAVKTDTANSYAVVSHATYGNAALKALIDAVGVIVTAIQTIFTGITSLGNWLRLLGRSSTPNAQALSEFNMGGGTYSAAAHSQQAIGARVASLSTATIVFRSPITSGGTVDITQGDDYSEANNRALPFGLPVEDWGDLSGATVEFIALHAESTIGAISGTLESGGTAEQFAQVELAAADTDGARASDNEQDTYQYACRVTLAGKHITTFRGPLILRQNLFA